MIQRNSMKFIRKNVKQQHMAHAHTQPWIPLRREQHKRQPMLGNSTLLFKPFKSKICNFSFNVLHHITIRLLQNLFRSCYGSEYMRYAHWSLYSKHRFFFLRKNVFSRGSKSLHLPLEFYCCWHTTTMAHGHHSTLDHAIHFGLRLCFGHLMDVLLR